MIFAVQMSVCYDNFKRYKLGGSVGRIFFILVKVNFTKSNCSGQSEDQRVKRDYSCASKLMYCLKAAYNRNPTHEEKKKFVSTPPSFPLTDEGWS